MSSSSAFLRGKRAAENYLCIYVGTYSRPTRPIPVVHGIGLDVSGWTTDPGYTIATSMEVIISKGFCIVSEWRATRVLGGGMRVRRPARLARARASPAARARRYAAPRAQVTPQA